jgi:hypothetical protein
MAFNVTMQPQLHAALHGYPLRYVHEVIALVNALNYVGPKHAPGTIDKTEAWRIDRQPGSVDVVNLQVQLNVRIEEPTTVAQAFVPLRYHLELGGADTPGYHARYTELTGAIQEALNESFRSRNKVPVDRARHHLSFIRAYSVTGGFSAPLN